LKRAQNYRVSKGGEHLLCDILINGAVKFPPAKWLGLILILALRVIAATRRVRIHSSAVAASKIAERGSLIYGTV
jgi:hypothetical protein